MLVAASFLLLYTGNILQAYEVGLHAYVLALRHGDVVGSLLKQTYHFPHAGFA